MDTELRGQNWMLFLGFGKSLNSTSSNYRISNKYLDLRNPQKRSKKDIYQPPARQLDTFMV